MSLNDHVEMTLRSALILLTPLAIACSASTSAPSGPVTDAATSETATGGGSVKAFTTYILSTCAAGTPTSSCPVQASITVFGEKLTRIEDATVTVNGEAVMGGEAGGYGGLLRAPYGDSYEIIVRRGSDELRRTLRAPKDFTFAITAPTAANQPTQITWTPSGEGALAEVQVSGAGGTKLLQGSDTGTMALEGALFPAAGDYGVSLTRSFTDTASGSNASIVSIAHTGMLKVP